MYCLQSGSSVSYLQESLVKRTSKRQFVTNLKAGLILLLIFSYRRSGRHEELIYCVNSLLLKVKKKS